MSELITCAIKNKEQICCNAAAAPHYISCKILTSCSRCCNLTLLILKAKLKITQIYYIVVVLSMSVTI